LENFFGFVRMDCENVNTADRMTMTITHTDIVKEAAHSLQLNEHVSGRVNLAGVQLDNNNPSNKIMDHIELANPMAPKAIAQICLKAVHVQQAVLSGEEQIGFLQFREYLGCYKRQQMRAGQTGR
jgi:hypothetical protein